MQRSTFLIAGVMTALFITGCTPQKMGYQPSSTIETSRLRSTVDIKDDQFEKSVLFIGPEETLGAGVLSEFNTYFIRSWVDKGTLVATHQVYVNDYGSGWKFWNSAKDENSNIMEFVSISSHVGSCRYGCSYFESFGASIDDKTLRSKRETGYRIKFSAKNGAEKVVHITPRQVIAQLEAIDARFPPQKVKEEAAQPKVKSDKQNQRQNKTLKQK
ncbi:hypothetical protein [Paramagnetospirillum magneticum]|uniref:hypothetical protein n=1 Tax=Paramagnetospirillum magneticum TaxID=84159 RepID=UPI0011D09DB3|nr:hypothetical protein [Paramagnetospirillum magneticum]